MNIFRLRKYPFMTIGQSIKRLRKQLGMTQIELANKAKVAQSQISQLESGISDNVTIGNLRNIAKALNCALTDLLPDTDKTIKK